MNDAQRYRMNAAECLSAAERCDPHYRGHLFCVAASWLGLGRREETSRDLLESWGIAAPCL
jgi:hypothetical protein